MSTPCPIVLPNKVPFRSDQTYRSWVSALAAANYALSGESLASILGLSRKAAHRPTDAELETFATVGEVDTEKLRCGLLATTTGRGRAVLNNTVISVPPGKMSFRACPACIAEDMNNQNYLCPEAMAYERRHWLLREYYRCHVHQVNLSQFPSEITDFASAVRSHQPFDRAKAFGGHAAWEYLAGRLAGEVDVLPFFGKSTYINQVDTAAILGCLQLFGHDANVKKLKDEQLGTALEAGFDLCLAGETAVAEFLDGLIISARMSGRRGLKGAFGPAVHLVASRRQGEFFHSLRVQMVEAAHRNNAYPHSTRMLLGLPAEPPTVFTINEVAQRLRVGPTLVEGMVEKLGHHLSENLISTAAAEDLFSRGRVLNATKAAHYLGIRGLTLKDMCDAGNLQWAVARQASDGKPLHSFWERDLDDFRARFLSHCSGKPRDQRDYVLPIVNAAQSVGRSLTEILTMLWERPCSWAYAPPDTTRISKILVHVTELRCEVRHKTKAFSVQSVADILEVDRTNITALVKSGILNHVMEPNAVNLRSQIAIPEDDLIEFQTSYISATALSRRSAHRARTISEYLSAQGIAATDTPTRFYLRSDIARITGTQNYQAMLDLLTGASRAHARKSKTEAGI